MSKISGEGLKKAVQEILATAHSAENKKKFLETIELQIALKNYDVNKDKRFNGSIKLPYIPRPKFSVCIIADQKHADECVANNLPFRTVEDLKKMNKNKKEVKKLAKKYSAFLSSADLIKKIPRILGPGLMRAGKFPSVVGHEDLQTKVDELKATVKFQLKKVMCMGVAVGNVSMTEEQITTNINMAVNFLVSLLKKNWQNIKRLYIKSTMGPSHRIYGF